MYFHGLSLFSQLNRELLPLLSFTHEFQIFKSQLGIHLPPVLKLEMLFFFFQRGSVHLYIQEFVPGKQNSMEFKNLV